MNLFQRLYITGGGLLITYLGYVSASPDDFPGTFARVLTLSAGFIILSYPICKSG